MSSGQVLCLYIFRKLTVYRIATLGRLAVSAKELKGQEVGVEIFLFV